MSLPPNR